MRGDCDTLHGMRTPFFFLILSVSFLAHATDYEMATKHVRENLSKFVEADTTNPPGNEARIVTIARKILSKAKIPYEVVEFSPGRQNIVARIKGEGAEKPLLILAHIDVVGAEGQPWTVNPHVVTEKEGYLYGRGVADDLGMAAIGLQTLLLLKESKVPLKRDVILALTGDEESGGDGIKFILEKKPKLIADATEALNEGGGITLDESGKVHHVSLQAGEKIYQDFEIVANGKTGHSSVPQKDNAIYRLSNALTRLEKHVFPARMLSVTRVYFEGRSKLEPPKMAKAMRDAARSKGKIPSDALKVLDADPIQSANLRTTCVATMLSGGTRVNALPAQAKASVNCRILPDETPQKMTEELKRIVADNSLNVVPLDDFGHAESSALGGSLDKAIQKMVGETWPGTPVIPYMSRGATDSRFLRAAGMVAYGLNPIPALEADGSRAHGIDERISAAGLRTGVEFFHRLVLNLAAK
jgi:acetylornithine deacetylase/succinyl-diaminopimelate desuccinylase-like protein